MFTTFLQTRRPDPWNVSQLNKMEYISFVPSHCQQALFLFFDRIFVLGLIKHIFGTAMQCWGIYLK